MWQRKVLKENAKQVLRRNYWMPFLVTLIFSLLAANEASSEPYSELTAHSVFLSVLIDPNRSQSYSSPGNVLGSQLDKYISFLTLYSLLGLFCFLIFYGIFIAMPLRVGMRRYFMENRIVKPGVGRLFWPFFQKNYLHIVKVMFIVKLRLLLWSLLFIIPGIIKHYEYSMIPYILAENPNLPMSRVFELSRQMTDNEKFEIFLMELSFIGLGFLCAFSCGIGTYFLMPYIQASFAELYEVMREKVFQLGLSYPGEFPGFVPGQ